MGAWGFSPESVAAMATALAVVAASVAAFGSWHPQRRLVRINEARDRTRVQVLPNFCGAQPGTPMDWTDEP